MDNWKHRAAHMTCQTCMWFVFKDLAEENTKSLNLGRCRRHAPTLSGWPALFGTDWCGDHKLDQDKL